MNINPFESRDVEISSSLSVEKAIDNLRRRVGDPKHESMPEERMVGSVSQSDTYIYRGVPGARNSFRPTFYGSFSGSETQSVLKGVVCLNRVIQKFIYIWMGIVAVVAVVTLFTILKNPAASWGSLLQVLIMFVAVYVMFVVLKNKCEPDVEWLKSNIKSAIDTSDHGD